LRASYFYPLLHRAALIKDAILAHCRVADISVFHEFSPPPCGGGHQFLRMLMEEFRKHGFIVENNKISSKTKACLFNSFNFDCSRLRYLHRAKIRMIHRIDGPITVYRGRDDGSDKMIFSMNMEFADASIFQSAYSMNKHLEMGMMFKNPIVIHNTVSPLIFNKEGRILFSENRRIKILAASWSDNINKGFDVYKWLEERLDMDRYDFTFVGRSHIKFKHIKMLKPLPSEELAAIMRGHDVFISGSKYESCSNVVLEALSCGMPVIFHNSGGTPEIVGSAGYGFESIEEIPFLLDKMVSSYETLVDQIQLPKPADVASKYLRVMGVGENL
jgi:glycosyltransferase involved in cell wall biosynthesis